MLIRSSRTMRWCAVIGIAAGLALSTSALAADKLFTDKETVPADAIVLFDGTDLSKWVKAETDQPAEWKIQDGWTTPSGGDIATKQTFGDCQVHVEFWVPLMPNNHGQARGNSGVFFMQWSYEVQILDSYGLNSNQNDCAAIYNIHPPMVNACRPPEHWQSFDIFFIAPKFGADGKKIANARMSVLHNGVWVHDNADVPHPTPAADRVEPKGPAPLRLQDHGFPVRFRNVWVRPLGEAK